MRFRYILCFTIKNYSCAISVRKARPILLDLQHYKCLMCDQTFSKYIPHEIHHIDHNKQNNSLNNFAALCANCHSAHHRYNITFPIEKHKKIIETFYLSNKNESVHKIK